MKKLLMLLLAGTCGLVWAQTNAPVAAPAPAKPEATAEIRSDQGYFDGNTRQMVYENHVVVTYPKIKMTCERLTISIPANNEHPTNAMAETNVVIEMLDEKGQTNRVTADKAVYDYNVTGNVTNETVNFIGGNPSPQVDTPQFIITGDPLVWNLATKRYSGVNYKTTLKPNAKMGNGTNNATPFDLFK